MTAMSIVIKGLKALAVESLFAVRRFLAVPARRTVFRALDCRHSRQPAAACLNHDRTNLERNSA